MAISEGEIFTLDEVTAYLKAGNRTIYRLVQEGEIPAFKLGESWCFRRAEFEQLIVANIENTKNKVSANVHFYRFALHIKK